MKITKEEQDDNFRLKNAKDHLAFARDAETQARAAFNAAVEDSKGAKERYENLFDECEKRAVARRKSGQITVSSQY